MGALDDVDFPALATVLDQTQRAVDAGLYFPAIFTALTIPDVCAALSSENGRTSGAKYQAWLVEWTDYDPQHAKLLWGYRCSLLHQASGFAHGTGVRVIFAVPGSGRDMHRLWSMANEETAVLISVPAFVAEMREAAEAWSARVGPTTRVQRNLARSVHLRLDGIAPHIGGVPVIA